MDTPLSSMWKFSVLSRDLTLYWPRPHSFNTTSSTAFLYSLGLHYSAYLMVLACILPWRGGGGGTYILNFLHFCRRLFQVISTHAIVQLESRCRQCHLSKYVECIVTKYADTVLWTTALLWESAFSELFRDSYDYSLWKWEVMNLTNECTSELATWGKVS